MFFFFFFNDTATTEIYTLSLHDALPISVEHGVDLDLVAGRRALEDLGEFLPAAVLDLELVEEAVELGLRSEEHTSELQSRQYLVCRLLLEKKNNIRKNIRKNPSSHRTIL